MQRSLLVILVSFALCLALSSCRDPAKEARRKELLELMDGNTDNADMKAATEKARATVGEFLTALQKPAANQGNFLIRKSFPRKDGKQQVLSVTQLSYDGKLVHGTLDDLFRARPGNGVPPDGKIAFEPQEIADWMYREGDQAVGGYTFRVLKKTQTEEEWTRDTGRTIKSFKEEPGSPSTPAITPPAPNPPPPARTAPAAK